MTWYAEHPHFILRAEGPPELLDPSNFLTWQAPFHTGPPPVALPQVPAAPSIAKRHYLLSLRPESPLPPPFEMAPPSAMSRGFLRELPPTVAPERRRPQPPRKLLRREMGHRSRSRSFDRNIPQIPPSNTSSIFSSLRSILIEVQ